MMTSAKKLAIEDRIMEPSKEMGLMKSEISIMDCSEDTNGWPEEYMSSWFLSPQFSIHFTHDLRLKLYQPQNSTYPKMLQMDAFYKTPTKKYLTILI